MEKFNIYDLDEAKKLVQARIWLEWKEEAMNKPRLQSCIKMKDFDQVAVLTK